MSHNTHTSKYNYKYTSSVEIVPICKVSNARTVLSGMGPCDETEFVQSLSDALSTRMLTAFSANLRAPWAMLQPICTFTKTAVIGTFSRTAG